MKIERTEKEQRKIKVKKHDIITLENKKLYKWEKILMITITKTKTFSTTYS